MDKSLIDQAVLSILENHELLYPVFSSILIMLKDVYDDLSSESQKAVVSHIHYLINSDSHVVRLDIHLIYAIRILSKSNDDDTSNLLQKLYDIKKSPLIRRDIILSMLKFGQWYWISDLRNRFRELSSHEKRAFIVASYMLKDEGQHWRKHISSELDPFEKFIQAWASKKAIGSGWKVTL